MPRCKVCDEYYPHLSQVRECKHKALENFRVSRTEKAALRREIKKAKRG